MHKIRLAFILLLSVALIGCSKPTQNNKEAVERGLLEYLNTRAGINMTSMDITISGVSFRENEADATVSFKAKGSQDTSNAMQMRYVLEQKDGKWVVKGRASGSEHGGQTAPPAGGGMPPAGGMSPHGGGAPAGEMPPNHPPTKTPEGSKK